MLICMMRDINLSKYMAFHFIVDSFLTGTLEPTNDQLPTSVAS